ncbi:peroxidase 3-like [Lycium ferocissimum]|uniref:peroxidase 3-like n=1 Tax=Lycium ferocissimum TaxID=112874 RepID=UPI002816188F|nr:peroxidase 3-like [Lycium ferocissimum]
MPTFSSLAFLVLIFVGILGSSHGQLQLNFYSKSCLKAEKMIQDYVQKHIPKAPSLAAALLRMHFHDCFVRGCDASVLLNSTKSTGNQTEKVAIPNQTLRGFSFIDGVKKIVEAECPGVVSCADIVALVARNCGTHFGGPYWNVPTGRRDGRISNSSEALADIPAPTSNFTRLQSSFAKKGLDLKDLVLLSANLKSKKCKSVNDNTTIVEMDPGSFRTFDLSYYKLLLKRRGLFQSDAALLTTSTTKSFIDQLVQGSLKEFYTEFAKAMEKMGKIEVKTGSNGEIRKQCAVVN